MINVGTGLRSDSLMRGSNGNGEGKYKGNRRGTVAIKNGRKQGYQRHGGRPRNEIIPKTRMLSQK